MGNEEIVEKRHNKEELHTIQSEEVEQAMIQYNKVDAPTVIFFNHNNLESNKSAS